MKNSAGKVDMQSFDDLFGSSPTGEEGQVIEVNLSQLYDFKNHPFQVRDDEEMLELEESIKERGVLVPGIVRKRQGGGYEIVAGHRRKHASHLAGKDSMQVICRELSDDDATLIMIDSNIQRENLLPSEKAWAYRMKMEALKHQGKKGGSTAVEIGEKTGDNVRTVQRYVRLTYLLPELLEAVDHNKIAVIAGSKLSFLSSEEQGWLLEVIEEQGCYPKGKAADQIKEYSKKGELTKELIQLLLKGKEKDTDTVQVVIKDKRIREYFPQTYDRQTIEEIIFSLLEKWKAAQEAE